MSSHSPKVTIDARSEHPQGGGAVGRLRARARRYLAALGCDGVEVSVLVVRDAAIRRLNSAWRGRDRATDVLSFPAVAPVADPGGAGARATGGARGGAGPRAGGRGTGEPLRPLGDVVLSHDTARRVARREGRRVEDELGRYLAHGLLHLLGYDHRRPAEARRMAAAEDALVGEGMVGRVTSGESWAGTEEPSRRAAETGTVSALRSRPRSRPAAATARRRPASRATGRGSSGRGSRR